MRCSRPSSRASWALSTSSNSPAAPPAVAFHHGSWRAACSPGLWAEVGSQKPEAGGYAGAFSWLVRVVSWAILVGSQVGVCGRWASDGCARVYCACAVYVQTLLVVPGQRAALGCCRRAALMHPYRIRLAGGSGRGHNLPGSGQSSGAVVCTPRCCLCFLQS